MKTQHTAIYLRVSTKQQKLEAQRDELQRWAKAQDGPIQWYEDKFTGTTFDRPGWTALEANYRSGKVSRIVVWRIDRLGRNTKLLVTLFEELQERGVGLVSLRDGIDLETPTGRLVASVLASVAQFETELRDERQTLGIARAKAAGKTWGGSKKGSRRKVTTEQMDAIRTLRNQGTPIAKIARAVGLSRNTLYSVLEPK